MSPQEDSFWRLELEGLSPERLPPLPKKLEYLNIWALETGRWVLEIKGPEGELRDFWTALPAEHRIRFQRLKRPGQLKKLQYSRLEICWGTQDRSNAIHLDPTGAFGSGTHPTTVLILDFLDTLWHQGVCPQKILDIGTGSGILALTAARLWNAPVWAVDIDPEAVSMAQKNIYTNRLEKKIHLVCGTADSLKGPFDLILANIYLRVLLQEADTVQSLLAPGGHLLATGFLLGSEAPLLRKYAKLSLIKRQSQGEWLAIWWQKT